MQQLVVMEQIQRFSLKHQLISDEDFSNIVQSLDHVQELTLHECGITSNMVARLAELWQETKPDVSSHKLFRINISVTV